MKLGYWEIFETVDPLSITISIIMLILIPIVGLLIMGIDRKVSARMQNRIGPPITQPFRDLSKLFSKREDYVNNLALVMAYAHVIVMFAAAVLLVFLQDFIVVFFTLTLAMIFLFVGALSTGSPYSYIGGFRELMRIICMETLFLFVVVTIGIEQDTFMLREIVLSLEQPLIYKMPLSYIAMVLVFLLAMEKPPFDIPVAHQEVIQGPLTDYSGRWFGMFKIAHAVEISIIMLVMWLFFIPNTIMAIIAIVITFLVVEVVGNATTRTTYKGMVKFSFTFGLILVIANLVGVIMW